MSEAVFVRDFLGLVGTEVGPYVVRKVSSIGGFAVLYQAEHTSMHFPVALKVLTAEVAPEESRATLEQFFLREAQILGQLRSEHVLRAHHHGKVLCPKDQRERSYMVTDWLDGRELGELFHERLEALKPFSIEEAIELLEPIALALEAVHAAGLVHRDVNPRNIFLENAPEGGLPHAKLIDFGFAKEAAQHSALRIDSPDGTLLAGSPDFASPEHYERERFGDPSPKSDLYTFALTLVQSLTLEPPLQGDTPRDLYLATLDPANRPTPNRRGAKVSADVERLFVQALAVDPRARPSSVLSWWNQLKRAAQLHPVQAAELAGAPASAPGPAGGVPGVPQPPRPGVPRPSPPRPGASRAPAGLRPKSAPPPPSSMPKSAPPPPSSRPKSAPPPPSRPLRAATPEVELGDVVELSSSQLLEVDSPKPAEAPPIVPVPVVAAGAPAAVAPDEPVPLVKLTPERAERPHSAAVEVAAPPIEVGPPPATPALAATPPLELPPTIDRQEASAAPAQAPELPQPPPPPLALAEPFAPPAPSAPAVAPPPPSESVASDSLLTEWAESAPQSQPPSLPPPSIPPPVRRRRVLPIVLVALVLLGAGAVLVAATLGKTWRPFKPTCDPGFADCNGLSEDGCEVNLQTDAVHCGVCGTSCSSAGFEGSCSAGKCAVKRCLNQGKADCNQTFGDGCEAKVDDDPANCGGCGQSCGDAGATKVSCEAGSCSISCQRGYGDCDGDAKSGCEAKLDEDGRNCGYCSFSCGELACQSGMCAPKAVATASEPEFLGTHSGEVYWWDKKTGEVRSQAPGADPVTLAKVTGKLNDLKVTKDLAIWSSGDRALVYAKARQDDARPKRLAGPLRGPTTFSVSADGAFVSWLDGPASAKNRPAKGASKIATAKFDASLLDEKPTVTECKVAADTFAGDASNQYCCARGQMLLAYTCAEEKCEEKQFRVGCPPELLLEASALYFTQGVRVLAMDRSSGKILQLAQRRQLVSQLALSDTHVYWSEGRSKPELWRAPRDPEKDKSGAQRVNRASSAGADFALGSAAGYWFHPAETDAGTSFELLSAPLGMAQ